MCGWIIELYAQIKVSGGTKGRQRFRTLLPEAYFFRDFECVYFRNDARRRGPQDIL